ncbi:MAG: HprK-related kinase A [Gammaproteobacteria bacterium]|nr:MAG: HprK-related kinase A [Gammaproteobacteria bacterium]
MKLHSLSRADLASRLEKGLILASGPFTFSIRGRYPMLHDALYLLYSDHPVLPDDSFVDFPVALTPPNPLRRFFRPQVQFHFDQDRPFYPLPANQVFASFEWGLNWVISNHAHQFIMLHAAVVEKNGRALVLPGEPGAGKSTLCAALMLEGWRLLSDEITLIRPGTREAWPLCRPASLKNASIELIRARYPEAVLGPVVDATSKGRVTHLKPAPDSIERMEVPAPITWFVFPRYDSASETNLIPRSRADSFLDVARNAFNYSHHGERGFSTVQQILSHAACYSLHYSDLDEALSVLDSLPPPEPLEPECLNCPP